jgi:uncharacterized protein YbgA (DUF1722 family)/uncharacterized protein YbbK (DUF523 family)
MRQFARPILVASKCLEFEACRWNGVRLPEPLIKKLEPYVEFAPVCPEFEIGLGIPRDPIRIVLKGTKHHLIQPATGRDVTDLMRRFSDSFLKSVGQVDGFILKSRSPSCGLKDVKVYPSIEKSASVGKDSGLFADAALTAFPNLAIEDEGRLSNFRIREHFLTRIFAYAAWRQIYNRGAMGDLVQFQATNKLLLMAYNQKEMRILGKLVANLEKRKLSDIFADYDLHFKQALASMPRFVSHINVLMHALGYFKELTSSEKKHFLKTLETYRAGKLPLSVPLSIVQSWIARFDEHYLALQTYFEPYPEELVEITDSGKGRDY